MPDYEHLGQLGLLSFWRSVEKLRPENGLANNYKGIFGEAFRLSMNAKQWRCILNTLSWEFSVRIYAISIAFVALRLMPKPQPWESEVYSPKSVEFGPFVLLFGWGLRKIDNCDAETKKALAMAIWAASTTPLSASISPRLEKMVARNCLLFWQQLTPADFEGWPPELRLSERAIEEVTGRLSAGQWIASRERELQEDPSWSTLQQLRQFDIDCLGGKGIGHWWPQASCEAYAKLMRFGKVPKDSLPDFTNLGFGMELLAATAGQLLNNAGDDLVGEDPAGPAPITSVQLAEIHLYAFERLNEEEFRNHLEWLQETKASVWWRESATWANHFNDEWERTEFLEVRRLADRIRIQRANDFRAGRK